MARPLTVYKDGHSVSNVYPSELNYWLAEGWATSPDVVAPPPVQPVAEVRSREEELSALGWRELKAIAGKLGIEKTEDQSWEDLIPAILEAENR